MRLALVSVLYFLVLTGYANSGPKPKQPAKPPCTYGTDRFCNPPPFHIVKFKHKVCTKLDPHGDGELWFRRPHCTGANGLSPDQSDCATEERV